MKDVNKVILLGRLGADPIQRQTKTGTHVVHFSDATTRKYLKNEGEGGPDSGSSEWAEETQWHRIVAWGKRGETCAQYLKKGNPVYIEGSLRSHSYKDKEGVQRSTFEINADTISFLGGRSSASQNGQPSQNQKTQSQQASSYDSQETHAISSAIPEEYLVE